MIEALRKPANIATGVRLVSIPVLWVFSFLGEGMYRAPWAEKLDPFEAMRHE